jgi:thioredoxin-dependent peroxiredoxin
VAEWFKAVVLKTIKRKLQGFESSRLRHIYLSSGGTRMLSAGQKAPDFELPATGGKTIKLSDYAGQKNVVLYFYPKDDTPGCTKEACFFRDVQAEFESARAAILGVSVDSAASHEKFAAKYHLLFSLLSDENKEIVQAYQVWVEKNNYGRKYFGTERTTFAIDKTGIIRKIWSKVKVEGHIDEVLEFVRTL